MNSEIRKLSDPSPTWNSAPISGNAAAVSNQLRVRAMKPEQIRASMPQRIAPDAWAEGGAEREADDVVMLSSEGQLLLCSGLDKPIVSSGNERRSVLRILPTL